ncbi:MAG TPA: hypothetical protein VGP72_26560 [Planctomycetota bacterium]|jgi:hypothetical protein
MRHYFFALIVLAMAITAAEPVQLSIDATKETGEARPRVGFLGGLRDEIPDSTIQPLHPTLWRIGHQFRGRIKSGLNGAIDRVSVLGATYKLVMSDLIDSKPQTDWTKYEDDVKKLVREVGPRAKTIIWEPVNEPDCSHKPIDKYYELYGHAFKALREAEPAALICGPGFAFPNFEKYRVFLDYCRDHKLECNYLAWHFTGWDPNYPEQAKWKLGDMRQFIAQYPEQKIREIHCDEWGAGPDKPGRLHPGRAVVWFHYLENVYKVDRACRANWGKEDDYLGGIVTLKGETYPVYHAYRLYGQMTGKMLSVSGNSSTLACLAAKNKDALQILVGSIRKGQEQVVLEIKGFKGKIETAQMIPGKDLNTPLTTLPPLNAKLEQRNGAVRITLDMEENQACFLVLKPE